MKPMLTPVKSIRIRVECPRRLLLQQLNRTSSFHARPQKRRRQKNIYKTMHNSRSALGLIVEPVHRAQRMVQSRGRLERYIGSRTQANEFDHALRSGKLVSRLAACPDFRSSPVVGHRRNAFGATGQRNFKIGRELCRDDHGEPLDLLGTRNLHLNRLDNSPSAGTGVSNSRIEFANVRDIRNRIGAQKDGQPPVREARSRRWSWQSGKRFLELTEPRDRNNKTPENPVP